MTYEETLAWLYGLAPRGIRLELDRMRAACALARDPQRSLAVIHVAGTNGKGSTSAMIERIARASGLRTGLYTSPHLHSFRERVRVDGAPIEAAEIAERARSLRALLAGPSAPPLTFFELTTLLAFGAFADRALDLVVLEVGLGGRFDATNVIERPEVSVITHVDLDHQAYLGSTLSAIAAEKVGIVRAGVPVVHAGDAPLERREVSVDALIDARARALSAPSIALGRELALERDGERWAVTLGARRVAGLTLGLRGPHQARNAALAVGAVLSFAERGARRTGLAITDEAVRAGVRDVAWPGRLEPITRDGVHYLLDAAHNPDGARALAADLAGRARERPRVLVFGAMADKDWREELAILAPLVDAIVTVAPALARAERAEVLARHVGGHAASSVADGLEDASRRAGAAGLVVVCGSIFLLAEARARLLGIEQEPLLGM